MLFASNDLIVQEGGQTQHQQTAGRRRKARGTRRRRRSTKGTRRRRRKSRRH